MCPLPGQGPDSESGPKLYNMFTKYLAEATNSKKNVLNKDAAVYQPKSVGKYSFSSSINLVLFAKVFGKNLFLST